MCGQGRAERGTWLARRCRAGHEIPRGASQHDANLAVVRGCRRAWRRRRLWRQPEAADEGAGSLPATTVQRSRKPSPAPAADRPDLRRSSRPRSAISTTGERELKAGHLDSARAAFDQAVEVLLESPYGARTDARMREHFDRLIDRINAYEVTALAQGDGFTEKNYEAAPIDEIAEERHDVPGADGGRGDEGGGEGRPRSTTAHDIPIPEHAKVLSYVEVFQGAAARLHPGQPGRAARQYLPMIQSVFRAEGLPLDLAYIPIIESSFKTNALSKASAKGPWQFMKADGAGARAEDQLVHRRAVGSREGDASRRRKYLKTLSKMFDGDWNLVLAAYNGGPGRVQRAMKRSGRSTTSGARRGGPKYLPRETREYVPLILAAMIIARNPAQYRLRCRSTAEPIAYDKVALSRAPSTSAASPNGPARRSTRSRR